MSQKHSCGHEDDICDECHNTIFHFSQPRSFISANPELRKYTDKVKELTIIQILSNMERNKMESISYVQLRKVLDKLQEE